mgnify:CR=1 FL=1
MFKNYTVVLNDADVERMKQLKHNLSGSLRELMRDNLKEFYGSRGQTDAEKAADSLIAVRDMELRELDLRDQLEKEKDFDKAIMIRQEQKELSQKIKEGYESRAEEALEMARKRAVDMLGVGKDG